MRKLIAMAILAALMAMPVAAAPVNVDHGPSITTRVLEHVAQWLAKLWTVGDPDDDDDDVGPPPLDGIGMDVDPNG